MRILGTMLPFLLQPGLYIWQDYSKELAAAVYLVVGQAVYITTKRKEFLELQSAFPYRG